jgi:hypothetical protein
MAALLSFPKRDLAVAGRYATQLKLPIAVISTTAQTAHRCHFRLSTLLFIEGRITT